MCSFQMAFKQLSSSFQIQNSIMKTKQRLYCRLRALAPGVTSPLNMFSIDLPCNTLILMVSRSIQQNCLFQKKTFPLQLEKIFFERKSVQPGPYRARDSKYNRSTCIIDISFKIFLSKSVVLEQWTKASKHFCFQIYNL